ncbi:hypothetical protein THIAE_07600 [Thiomicrospira aerophila AL3]|uniref:MlaB-like STAS domain-containing protein n=1 Tax=Thiomicrospira aerophila AL3 TaxID=717772 RepID=W0DZQ9_9GAMM|nr:STAS domain-containing protein [Thiomicrospira aerophila]AHF02336.1 hypothetical protein THIAE_07600 [Thiomicrospira aerophila AL3]
MSLTWQLTDQSLQLKGLLTLAALHQQPKLQAWLKQTSLPFQVIDLAGVTQIDSAGLAWLTCCLDQSAGVQIRDLPAAGLELAQLYNLQDSLNRAAT